MSKGEGLYPAPTNQRIDDLDARISNIQKGTRALIPGVVPLHDILRQKFRWYKRWSSWPLSKTINFLVLFIYIAGASYFGINGLMNSNRVLAATTGCTWTNGHSTGIWNDAANWSCGTVPDNTSDVIFNGAVSNANITIDVAATAASFTVNDATGGGGGVAGQATAENTGNHLNFSTNSANVAVSGAGVFSGYGWSEDLGWIAFGTADNAADGPVSENTSTGAVTGKAKILNDGTLIDFNASPYNSNVVVNTGTGVFSGYAWSTSLGWINFTGVSLSSPAYTGTITANQNLTLDTASGGTGSYYLGGGTYIANATTITVPGSWTNAGTFTAGSGTVTFDGTNEATVSGSTTFNNLTMDSSAAAKTIKFTAGTTQTIAGTWTLDGAVGNVLTLRSTSDTNAWNFNISAPFTTGDYIDIKDSYSANANKITPGANVTNSGNNDGWIFGNSCQSAATGNWSDAASWTACGGTYPQPGDSATILDTHTITLTADASVTNVTVNSGGNITHSDNSTAETYKLNLTIQGDLTVASGGTINVDGLGYDAGSGPGGSTSAGDGGSYGGIGADYNSNGIACATYGSITAPTNIGSGGWDASNSGGGAVRLNVTGASTIEGIVTANGAVGGNYGGGSGGSVYLTTGTISGAGTIRANGGTGGTYGGGGGRVAVILTSGNDFGSVVTTAYGGPVAAAGTVYEQTQAQGTNGGTLTIDNNNVTTTAGVVTDINSTVTGIPSNPASIIVLNTGKLQISSGATLTIPTGGTFAGDAAAHNDQLILNGGTLATPATFSYTNADILIKAASTFSPTTLLTIGDKAVLIDNVAHTIAGSVTVASGGNITHSDNSSAETYKMNLTIQGDLTVAFGGTINVDGLGYDAGSGPGRSGGGTTTWNGASYGGIGGLGSSVLGATYGSITAPTNIGSGGWDASNSGGGAVRLNVTGVSTIEGIVTANGAVGDSVGGGSGGSVYLTTGTISGAGTIRAYGGASYNFSVGGGGGGGRIAVISNTGNDFGSVVTNAYGGDSLAASSDGAAGTIYKQTQTQGANGGTLTVDNFVGASVAAGVVTDINSTVTDTTVGDLTIANTGKLQVGAGTTLILVGTTWTGVTSSNMTANSTSTITYTGGSAVTLINLTSYGNLTLNKSGTTFTLPANIDINGNFLNSAGTFDANSLDMTIAGNFTNSDTFTAGTSTVNFTKATDTQTLNSGGVAAANTFNNVTHNGAGTLQLLTNDLDVNGNFTNSAGTFDTNAKNMNVAGNVDLTTGSFTQGTRTVTLDGSATQLFTAGGTGAGHTPYNLILANTSGVSAGVTFTDSLTLASGGRLTNTTQDSRVIFADGGTYTIPNITITGAAAHNILLQKGTGAHGHWHFVVAGTPAVSYATPSNSDATGSGAAITGGTDGGNNTNWDFGAAVPNAPTIGAPTVQSATSIRWTFVDNSSNETGFKVYDGSNTLKATCDGIDFTYCDETSMDVNTLYNDRYVVAYNANGNSTNSGTAAAIYTLANTPTAPTVNATSSLSLTVIIDQNGNPDPATTYEINETTTGNFVQADGTLNTSEVYQTYTQWGTTGGIINTGLTASTLYTYQIKAKNGDSTATAFGPTASQTTLGTGDTIAGSLYDGIGGAKISTAKTINISVNGGAVGTQTAETSAGDYNITVPTLAANDIITIFVSGETEKASTVTKVSASGGLTGIDLFQNYTTIRHEGTIASITNTDLATADNIADTDILFSVDGSNIASYTQGLYILATKTYAPGADINIVGSYTNAGTFTAGTSTVTFNGTATGKTINPGASSFYNLTFNGSGGAWSPLTNTVTVTNDLTMTAGTFDTSNGTANVIVNGNVACGASCGTINMTATNTFTQNVAASKNFGTSVAGTTAWTFNNLTFTKSAGTPTITTSTTATGDITVNGVMTIAASTTFDAGNRTYHLMGSGTPFANSGTFTANTSTFSYEKTSGNITISSATYYDLQTSPASGTVTYTLGNGGYSAPCFLAGTKILVKNGETKNIEDLKQGEKILSYDVLSGQPVESTVEQTFKSSVDRYYIINDKVRPTDNHVFFLADKSMKQVKDLKVGDVLATSSGTETVNKIEIVNQYVEVYDIEVETYHTFYAENYLVHNADAVTVNNNFTLTGAGAGTVDIGNSNPYVTINGNVSISSGQTLIASNISTFNVKGNWTNAGTFTKGTGTVTFNGIATGKTINPGASSFYNLTFNGSGGAWSPLTNTVTVTNDLTMTAGTFDTSNGTANVTVNGNVAGTAGVINMTTTNTFTQRISVNKNFGNTSGSVNWTFYNLNFENSYDTNRTIATVAGGTGQIIVTNTLTIGKATASSNLTLDNETNDRIIDANGDVTITSRGVLSASSTASFTVAGNWSGNGVLIPNSGTVTFDKGSSSQTLNSSGITSGKIFNNLTHSGAGTLQLITNNINIDGDFTNSAGTFDTNSLDMTIAGNVDLTGGSFTQGTRTITLDGAATQLFTAGGTGAGHTPYNLTLANTSGVSAGVTFFDSLTLASGGRLTDTTQDSRVIFADGGTYTIPNITITGAAAHNILLQKGTGSHGQWHFVVAGTPSVSYATPSNSDATGSGAAITGGTDGGNNTNWDFGAAVPNAPTIGVPTVQSATSIRWALTDNSSNETGFKVYDGASALKATCATADLAYCDETGMDVNTLFNDRYVVAYNANGNSTNSGTAAAIYTLADTPVAPTVNQIYGQPTQLQTIVGVNTNPASTQFAIQETQQSEPDKYVQADGSLNTDAVWQTFAQWGSGTGTTITGLTAGTQYNFDVKARNGDNTETAFGTPGAQQTTPGAGNTVSGSLYDGIGGAKISAAKTIHVSVNGNAAATTETSAGDYTVTANEPLDANDIITVFVSGETEKASTVTKVSASGGLTGIDLFQNYTTLRHEGTIASIINTDLATADNIADTDILFSVDGSNIASYTQGLYILATKTYAPGGDINIAGSYTNAGTFTKGTGTVTFNGTASGKIIHPGASSFYNLTFNSQDGNGVWSPNDDSHNITVTNDLTMTAGTFDHSNGSRDVVVNGNVTGTNGIINFYNGYLYQKVVADKSFGTTSGNADWRIAYLYIDNISPTNDATVTIAGGGTGKIITKITDNGNPYGSLTIGSYRTHKITLDNQTNNRIIEANQFQIDTNGAFLASQTASFTVASDWTNLNEFIANSGTVTFDGAGAQTITPGGSSFYNLISNKTGTGANDDLTLAASTGITNDLTLTDGEFKPVSYTVTLGGNLSVATASSGITYGTSTFIFDGVSKTISGTNTSLGLYNITVNAGKSVTDNIALTNIHGPTFTVNGTFTVGDGKQTWLTSANQTLAIGNGGLLEGVDVADSIFQMYSDATPTITLTGTGNFGPNLYVQFWLTNVTSLALPSLNYKAGKVEVYAATIVYSTTFTITPTAGTLDIDGGLVLICEGWGGSIPVLDFNNSNNATINIGGSFTRTETTGGTVKYTKGTSDTINFDGAGTQTFDPGALSTFNNITHSGAGTLQLTNTNLNMDGNFTNSAGTFDTNGKDMTVAGNVDLTGGSFTQGTRTMTLDGSATQLFTAGGTGAGHTPYNLTLANTSGVSAGVTFTDSLTLATDGRLTNTTQDSRVIFADNGTYTMPNITITGAAAHNILLQKGTGAHGHWHFVVAGTPSVSYATPSNSDATGSGAAITGGTDGGNNTNWDFGAAVPNAPTIGTPTVQSATSIRWAFADNSSNETGFKVYDGASALKATCATADLTYCDEVGMAVNTLFNDRYVVAYNANGNSTNSGTAAAIYTLANTPLAPTVNQIYGQPTQLQLIVGVNTNPASTQFAIQETQQSEPDQYVQADGSLNTDAVWQTFAQWGSGTGTTITGLTAGTQYTFDVKARNGDNTETAFGTPGAQQTTAGAGNTVSGSLYDGIGGAKISAAKTIHVSVNGNAAATTETSAGDYTITANEPLDANDIITIFVSGETEKASTVTKISASGNLTGIDLFQNYTTIRHEGSIASIINTDLATADNLADSDELFSVSGSTATYTQGLYILTAKTYAPGGDTQATNVFIAGTFTAGSYTHTASGNWTANGTFTYNTSTVNLTGTSQITASSNTNNFYNLTAAAAGTTTTLPSFGTDNIYHTLTLGTGNLNGQYAYVYFLASISDPLVNNGVTFTSNIVTFYFYGNGNINIPGFGTGASTYLYLYLGANGNNATYTATGNISVADFALINATLGYTATFDTGGFSFTSPTVDIGYFSGPTRGISVFKPTGASAVSIGDSGLKISAGTDASHHDNLDLSSYSGTFNLTGNFVNNDTITAGSSTINFTKTAGTQTLNSGGTGTGKIFNNVTHSGAGTLQLANTALNIDGVFTNSAGTFDANGLNMTVADDFLGAGGTFSSGGTPGTQTVTFDGTNEATVSGSTTFNNLTMDSSAAAKTIKFTAGTTQTINGTWTLDGASGKVLTLRSTLPGTAWKFVIPANFTAGDYIDVKDSQNTTNAYRITPGANTTDSGNNDPGWNFAPAAPTIGTPVAVSATAIEWHFTDTSSIETGFKVYDSGDNLVATCATADLTYCTETGLSVNTQYTGRYIVAYNAIGNSPHSVAAASIYTLANTPSAPTLSNVAGQTDQLMMIITAGDSNPGGTTYAIYETSTSKYVQADGSLDTSVIYQTAAIWGIKTVTGLSANTNYTFEAKAKNGDGVATISFGPTASKYTLIEIPTGISFGSVNDDSIAMSATGSLSNLSADLSGIQFTETSGNPGAGGQGGFNPLWTNTNNATDTGLSLGIQYSYKVKARNGDGVQTTETSVYNQTTTTTGLTAPSGAGLTADSTTRLTAAWTDNSTAETGFKVYISTVANTDCSLATYPGTPNYTTAAGATNRVLSPLSINTQYCAKVTATTGLVDSSPAYAAVPKYTFIQTPSGLSFDTLTATSIAMHSTNTPANLTAGQSGLVFTETSGNSGAGGQACFTNTTDNTCADTGLAVNTQYSFKVKAKNGDGVATAETTVLNKYTFANTPAIPVVSATSVTSLNSVINVNANPSYTQFAVYNETTSEYVQADGSLDTHAFWQTFAQWNAGSGIDTSGLVANTSYTYKIRVRNGDNLETTTPQLSDGTAKYTLIETPTGISFDTITTSSITISSSGVLSNLSAGLSGLYFTNCNDSWTQNNTCIKNTLTPNTQYPFKVKAKNGDGVVTAETAVSDKYTLANIPGVPSVAGNYSEADGYFVDLTLNANGNPNGTEYKINAGDWLAQNDGATQKATGLNCNQNYIYTATGRNGDLVNTATTAENSDMTPLCAPDTLAEAGLTATSAVLGWSAVEGTNPVYDIGFGTDTVATNLGQTNNVVGLTLAQGALEPSTIYYFKTRAHNLNGTGAWSAVKNFTTHPTADRLLISLPGQSYDPGSGIVGTPNHQTAGVPFTAKIVAVDTSNNLTDDYNHQIAFTAPTDYLLSTYSSAGSHPAPSATLSGGTKDVVFTLYQAKSQIISASGSSGSSTNFMVDPGSTVGNKSTVTPLAQSLATTQTAMITVNLKDAYGNNVADHILSVSSDQPGDNALALAPTDASGATTITVASGLAHTSTLTITDSIDAVTLTTRPQVVFVASGSGCIEKPTAPSNLRATDIGQNNLALSWDPSVAACGLATYDVFNAHTGIKIASSKDRNLDLADLGANTSYSFFVMATDLSGNTSQPSNTLTVKTLYSGQTIESTNICHAGGGQVAFLVLGNTPAETVSGQTFPESVVIKAMAADGGGELCEAYRGMVYFTSTDNKADLTWNVEHPYSYTKQDAGEHVFDGSGFRLHTVGSQILTVTDKQVSGQAEIRVIAGSIIFQKAQDTVTNFFDHNSMKVNTAVVTTTTVLLLAPALVNVAVGLGNFLPQIIYWGTQLLQLIGMRRKRKPWGVVFNSQTGQPVSLALVRIFDKEYHRLLESVITDKKGRFGLLVRPGTFYLVVYKTGFKFPSQFKVSEFFENIYTSGNIHIDPKTDRTVVLNIPLDSEAKASVVFSFWVIIVKFNRFLQKICVPIMVIGLIFAIIMTMTSYHIFYLLSLILYVFFFVLEVFRSKRSRPYGVVSDVFGNPLETAIVRIFNKHSNRLIATDVTDVQGRFKFFVDPGIYYLMTAKPGYMDFKSHIMYLEGERTMVTTNIKLKKVEKQSPGKIRNW